MTLYIHSPSTTNKVCDCDQKVSVYKHKGVMTMICTKDVLINAMTHKGDQEHLKHIK